MTLLMKQYYYEYYGLWQCCCSHFRPSVGLIVQHLFFLYFILNLIPILGGLDKCILHVIISKCLSSLKSNVKIAKISIVTTVYSAFTSIKLIQLYVTEIDNIQDIEEDLLSSELCG